MMKLDEVTQSKSIQFKYKYSIEELNYESIVTANEFYPVNYKAKI